MPNPLREHAIDDMDVYSAPLVIFMDDMSGNISKQWNVHYSAYSSLALLPRKLLDHEENIKFIATSPHASPMEMLVAICNDVR